VKKIHAGIESKVTRYDWAKEVAPASPRSQRPATRPGHTALRRNRQFENPDSVRCHNIPELFLRNPDWHVVYDVDPDVAQATRHEFYDMASTERRWWSPSTSPSPRSAMSRRDGTKYRLVPIAWNSADLIVHRQIWQGGAVLIGGLICVRADGL